MEKYQIKRLGKLLLCSSATFLLCQSTLAYSQEANPLTQELLHLKNKQQFENVNENLKKAQQFLEDQL
ncbi:hemolysin activation/secretion protein-1 [Pasteurella multocida]|uniref:hemolysin activation/secretion protein-1 n=1 Tax=Pasteurella multocida TaxID=747 RepID=UPI0014808B2E|nr:hemolysin activation/secretion protein-1 [Pasteurella multocida]NNI65540.1 hemolysin activation/secretion protein-1 [Pasteurella multocida]